MQQLTQGTLTLFQTTKAERHTFASELVEQVKDGHLNPLQVQLQLKSMEDLINAIKENTEFKALVLGEAEKHGKRFEYMNSKIEIKEARPKYDYSVCFDSEYNQMEAELETLKIKMKERAKFLQTIPHAGVANPETGEMIYPPIKTSTTTIAVTLL